MKAKDMLRMLNSFDTHTILLIKHLLNERINMMESSSVISSEEIENFRSDRQSDLDPAMQMLL